ncbi:MAG TPA: PilZ domain-containing protein [Candidatus Methanoperedens sp.]|nr:PilZ domain-containing protein [Candidatus Methanoperedens sp.]
MPEGIEKRKHLRLSAMGPVEVVVQGGSPEIAYLASIGRGGLGLYLRQEIAPGQLLLASLHLLARGGNAEDLKVVARVRWARPVQSLCMAGLAFEQMSDARYALLLKHLHIIEAWQLGDRSTEVASTRIRFTVRE